MTNDLSIVAWHLHKFRQRDYTLYPRLSWICSLVYFVLFHFCSPLYTKKALLLLEEFFQGSSQSPSSSSSWSKTRTAKSQQMLNYIHLVFIIMLLLESKSVSWKKSSPLWTLDELKWSHLMIHFIQLDIYKQRCVRVMILFWLV